MRRPWALLADLVGPSCISIFAWLIALVESSSQVFAVLLHRFIVAIRETAGQKPFEPLTKTPRHVCLVIGRACRVPEIDSAARTILACGVERVTVCHDGSLALSCELYSECTSSDMGKSNVVESIRTGYSREENSQPDAVLILGKSCYATRFSLTALQLPKCADASLLYYSELVPLYSLHPSDVYLAVSMFQSKSQRFGR